MPTPLIDSLIASGELVLYHDYRAGHYLDLSGQGNDGVPTDIDWQGGGVRFPLITSVITVADAPELQLTTGTLIVLGDFLIYQVGTNQRLISKEDAGGINYDTIINGNTFLIPDGTGNPVIAIDIRGSHYIAANFINAGAGEGFIDGLSIGAFSIPSVITVDNAPLLIGNRFTGSAQNPNAMHAALIVNRVLTATEHAQIYGELANMTWPNKVKGRARGEYGADLMTDGDMETVGVAAYGAVNDAVLTKQTGNAMTGSQVLRVAYAGPANNPEAYQNIGNVPAGRITGWARGDGTAYPSVWAGGDKWEGTVAATWQRFDVSAVDVMVSIRLQCNIGAAGYCEFDDVTFQEMTVTETVFKTDWGAKVIGNRGAADPLTGTNYWVNAGNMGITTQTIDSEVCKAVTCAASGGFQVYAREFVGDPTQDAYGTWRFWFSKAAGSIFICHFISDDLAGTNGYSFQVSATEVVSLVHNGVGNLFTTAAAEVVADTWYEVRITRAQIDGEFTVYINDTLLVAATGANPVAENTVTTSDVLVFDIDTGDHVGVGSRTGSKALIKLHGVIAP